MSRYDTEARNQEVVKHHKSGMTIKELAEKFSRHELTIQRILKNPKSKGTLYLMRTLKTERNVDIIKLWLSGRSQSSIANQYRVSKQAVWFIVEKYRKGIYDEFFPNRS